MTDLVAWRDDPHRKPLLVTGVRQCGKTYLIRAFGEEHFQSLAYVNLERNAGAAGIFERDLDPRRIVTELSELYLDVPIVPGETLLFFDEIQAQPKAITALKYFAEDLPELAVIGAGSLLGVSLQGFSGVEQPFSFPVGKVDVVQLYPFSFREFLWSSGADWDSLLERYIPDEPIPETLFTSLIEQYNTYLIVGGMPEAVAMYRRTGDLDAVHRVQDMILLGYENDMTKYAPSTEFANLRQIWDSIPVQLSRENNKFVFSHVRKSARAKDLEASLNWLVGAGLVHLLTRVEVPRKPLSFHQDSSYYKVFFCDVGLIARRAGLSYRDLVNRGRETENFRGSLSENFVLGELVRLGYHPHFWRSANTAEVDFIVEVGETVIPIEVKSADNTQAKSYRSFINSFHPQLGFKMSLKNMGVTSIHWVDSRSGATRTWALPLPLIWLMPTIVEGQFVE